MLLCQGEEEVSAWSCWGRATFPKSVIRSACHSGLCPTSSLFLYQLSVLTLKHTVALLNAHCLGHVREDNLSLRQLPGDPVPPLPKGSLSLSQSVVCVFPLRATFIWEDTLWLLSSEVGRGQNVSLFAEGNLKLGACRSVDGWESYQLTITKMVEKGNTKPCPLESPWFLLSYGHLSYIHRRQGLWHCYII